MNGTAAAFQYLQKNYNPIEAAEQQKASLLAEAQTIISFWQMELQLGIISDEDRASLISWMRYIRAVQAVDTSKAPDIEWTEKPN
ncbi:tail fiber assembly protein [Mixta mediterraneensis]|uniref:tail fiber assembly protein n=1 Tax=Mixta mediterraneensis TaxID=2758443 RepID=UPI0030B874AD